MGEVLASPEERNVMGKGRASNNLRNVMEGMEVVTEEMEEGMRWRRKRME